MVCVECAVNWLNKFHTISLSTVIGDNFGDAVNQAAIMSQLRQKLGIRVVVQMENTEGDVLFEGSVTPNSSKDESGKLGLGFSEEC